MIFKKTSSTIYVPVQDTIKEEASEKSVEMNEPWK